MLFQLWRFVRPVAASTAAQTYSAAAAIRFARTAALVLEKTEPTVDVLRAAARIVHPATRHRHADHQDADGHHDHRCDHRHQEVQVEPLGNQVGQCHLAVVESPIRAVGGGCQRTYPLVTVAQHRHHPSFVGGSNTHAHAFCVVFGVLGGITKRQRERGGGEEEIVQKTNRKMVCRRKRKEKGGNRKKTD